MKKLICVLLSVILIFSVSAFAFGESKGEDLPFSNSEFFTMGDYTIHYRTFEPESQAKNQIMLLHGFGLSTVSLENLAEEYCEKGYRVVLADLPDFGYSSRETAKTQLLEREELIFSLMKSFGNTSWIVGGHSMGGGVAINLACDYSDYVCGLLLFAPQISTSPNCFTSAFFKTKLVTGLFSAIIGFAAKVPEIIRPLVAASFSDNDFAKTYDVSKIAKPLKISGTGAGYAIMQSHVKTTQLDKFSQLNVPVAILTCSNDKIANKTQLQKIMDASPENTFTFEFSKGGHMFMEYNPSETAEKTMDTIVSCSYITDVK